jgi:PKD repeat protein
MKYKAFLVFILIFLSSIMFMPNGDAFNFSTAKIDNIHTCPLDARTYVVSYHSDSNFYTYFRVYDTNGSAISAEITVDSTGADCENMMLSTSVCAFNSTTFVIVWWDGAEQDITFAIYNRTGTLKYGPTDIDSSAGSIGTVSVSCFNSTRFVIAWYDQAELDVDFIIINSVGSTLYGPTDVDVDSGSCTSISVSCFNSTRFVIAFYDGTDSDATFAIYNSVGTLLYGPTDADATIATSLSVTVACFNSTRFVIAWFDDVDQDITFSIYNSVGTLLYGPTDVDLTVGTDSNCAHVTTLNSTAFIITYLDSIEYDLSYIIYNSSGSQLKAKTDLESYPTSFMRQFYFNYACSYVASTGIAIFQSNWIIAYSNSTTQAVCKAFTPSGVIWNGITAYPPVSSYTYTSLIGNIIYGSSYKIYFNSTSTNSPTNCSWDLTGDGNFDSYGNNVNYSYSITQTITVRLKATNADGNDWENKSLTITINYIIPVSSFTYSSIVGTINYGSTYRVYFNATSTNNPNNHSWDLNGDGSFDKYGTNVYYDYSFVQNIVIKLYSSVPNNGDWENKSLFINITFNKPISNFTYSNLVGTINSGSTFEVYFNATSTNSPILYLWDLNGDGILESSGNKVTYNYSIAQTISVKLYSINNYGGDWENKTLFINITIIYNSPIANFTYTNTTGIIVSGSSLKIYFNSTSTNSPTNYSWDLNGDGNFDTYGNNVQYSYSISQIITVRLYVIKSGLGDWENKSISINLSIFAWVNNSPPSSVSNNTTYQYTFSVSFNNATFTISTNNSNITINQTTGKIYAPIVLIGIYNINITSTWNNLHLYYNYSITVSIIIYTWLNDIPDGDCHNETNYSFLFVPNRLSVFTINTNASFLVINSTTGLLNGSVNLTGIYYINITATNGGDSISYNYTLMVTATDSYSLNGELGLYVWIILMIVFLLISLYQPEWGIIGGIIWIVASLEMIVPLNIVLGLIVISIGMFIMVYGILELFKR